MTYLIVTDTLIDNLESLDLDLQYQKVSKDNLNLNEQSSLFEDSFYKFIHDAYFTYKNLQDHEYDFSLKYIFQIKKSNLQKFQDIETLTIVHNTSKSKEKYPWDLSNIIFSKNKNLDSELFLYFSNRESNFRSFFNFFTKEIFRLKLLINDILCNSSISEDEIATGFSNSKFLLFSRACFASLNLDSGGVAIIIPSISGDLTKSSQS